MNQPDPLRTSSPPAEEAPPPPLSPSPPADDGDPGRRDGGGRGGGGNGWSSRVGSLVLTAAGGFFCTRLLLLPVRLAHRWWAAGGDGPGRFGPVLDVVSLAVPALVAVILVATEVRRSRPEPELVPAHPRPAAGPAGGGAHGVDPSGVPGVAAATGAAGVARGVGAADGGGRASSTRRRDGGRLVGLWLFFGASIPAEFLAAYLPETGRLGDQLAALIFFGGLYGGPALLIRDLTIRTGRGWPTRLTWAAAFGLALPGLIDLSAFTTQWPAIPFWDELWRPTELPTLGTSAYPVVSFVLGHVVMSMAVPIATFDCLFPRWRHRPLLNRPLTVVVAVLFLLVSVAVRSEMHGETGASPGPLRTVVVAVLVLAALVVGWRLPGVRRRQDGREGVGRPEPSGPRRSGWGVGTTQGPGPWTLVAVGAVGLVGTDLLPPTWLGLTGLLVAAATAIVLIGRWSRRTGWGAGSAAALATGAMVGRSLIGFLTPVPLDGDPAAKYLQNVLMLVAVLGITWLVTSRAAESGGRRDAIEAD